MKKIIALILVFVVIFSLVSTLAACGGPKEKTETPKSDVVPTAPDDIPDDNENNTNNDSNNNDSNKDNNYNPEESGEID